MPWTPAQPRLLPQDSSEHYSVGPLLNPQEWASVMQHPAHASFKYQVSSSGHLGQVFLANQTVSPWDEPDFIDLNTPHQAPDVPFQIHQFNRAESSARHKRLEDINEAEVRARSEGAPQDPSEFEATCIVLLKLIAVLENDAPGALVELAYLRERLEVYETMYTEGDNKILAEEHSQTLDQYRRSLNEGSKSISLESGQIKPARRSLLAKKAKAAPISPPTSRHTKFATPFNSHPHKRERVEDSDDSDSDSSPSPSPCPKKQRTLGSYTPSASLTPEAATSPIDLTCESDNSNIDDEESEQSNHEPMEDIESEDEPNEGVDEEDYQESSNGYETEDLGYLSESAQVQIAIARSLEAETYTQGDWVGDSDDDDDQDSSTGGQVLESKAEEDEAEDKEFSIADESFDDEDMAGQEEFELVSDNFDEDMAGQEEFELVSDNFDEDMAGQEEFELVSDSFDEGDTAQKEEFDIVAEDFDEEENDSATASHSTENNSEGADSEDHGSEHHDSEDDDSDDSDSDDDDYAETYAKRHSNSSYSKYGGKSAPRPSTGASSTPFPRTIDNKKGSFHGGKASVTTKDKNKVAPAPKKKGTPKKKASGAPSPSTSGKPSKPGKKSRKWSSFEHDAIFEAIKARRIFEANNPGEPILRDLSLYAHTSEVLLSIGIIRSGGACKNYWSRYGRQEANYDEKRASTGKEQTGNAVSTSVQHKKKKSKK